MHAFISLGQIEVSAAAFGLGFAALTKTRQQLMVLIRSQALWTVIVDLALQLITPRVLWRLLGLLHDFELRRRYGRSWLEELSYVGPFQNGLDDGLLNTCSQRLLLAVRPRNYIDVLSRLPCDLVVLLVLFIL